jgi:hypothetical protein
VAGQFGMNRYLNGLAVLMASAWVGSLWAAGYIAAPVLFHALPDKALAGMLAGRLFAVTAYLGMVCGAYLLIYNCTRDGKQVLKQSMFWLIAIMLVLTLLAQYGMQPLLAEIREQALPLYVMNSPYAERFRLWHGIGSIAYLVQSLAGAALLLKMHSAKGPGKL